MNLAFKAWIPKISVFLLFVSSSIHAFECGEVRFDQELENNLLLRLVEVDNKKVTNEVNYLNRYSSHKIRPGERIFNIVQESMELYSNEEIAKLHRRKAPRYKSQLLMREKKLKPYYDKQVNHYLSVNVKPNKAYSFSLNGKNKIVLVTSEKSVCSSGKVLGEKKSQANISIDELPTGLGQKLRDAFSVKFEREEVTQQVKSIFNQATLYNHFGLVLDSKYGEYGGIRILSSQPNSLAFTMGLRTNDEIIEIEGTRVVKTSQKPLKQFESLIKSINYYSTLDIEIMRESLKKSLSHKIRPVVIPTNWITNENNSFPSSENWMRKRSESATLQYASIMLPLWEYLEEHYSDFERVKISAKPMQNKIIGISGVALKNIGLKVTDIDEQSFLDTSGLKVGDVIESVDDFLGQIADVQVVQKYFSTMEEGDEYKLKVKRGTTKVVVTGVYQQNNLSAFELFVDMESVSLVKKGLKKARNLKLVERDQSYNKRTWQFGRALKKGSTLPHRKNFGPTDNSKQNKKGGT